MRADGRTGRYDGADSRFYNYEIVPKNQVCPFANHEVMCGSGFIRPRVYGVSTHSYPFKLEERESST